MKVTKKSKSLIIFDLNGLLGHLTKSHKKHNNLGIYSADAKPIFEDNNTAVFARPNLNVIAFDLLVRDKKDYDVGVWSSAGMDDTRLMIDKFFGRFFTQ